MPRVSRDHLLARRRGIVLAAARCLQRNGLEGTAMRDLFRAANLSPGAVYRYFASKAELLAAVAAGSPSLVESALAAGGDEQGPAERLRRLFEACAAGPPAARLQLELETAALRSPAVAAALAARRRSARRELVRALDLPPAAANGELTELILTLCAGLARQRLLEPEADLAALVESAAALLSGRLA